MSLVGLNNHTTGSNNTIEDVTTPFRALFSGEGIISGLTVSQTSGGASAAIDIQPGYAAIDCGNAAFLIFRLKTALEDLAVPNIGTSKRYLVCLKVDLTNATQEFVVVEGSTTNDPDLTEGGSPLVYYLPIRRLLTDSDGIIVDAEIVGADGSLTTNNSTPEQIAKTAQILGTEPTGSIKMWPTNSAPSGYLILDGSAVSRVTYAALFAVVGTTYGVGDGSTTFNVPNIKGKVPVGRDAADATFDTLGETGGAKTHQLITAEMPVHTHVQDAHGHPGSTTGNSQLPTHANVGFGSGANPAIQSNNIATIEGQTTHNHTVTIANATAVNQNAGGDTAHNNLQPFIVLNYIIKT